MKGNCVYHKTEHLENGVDLQDGKIVIFLDILTEKVYQSIFEYKR